MRNELDPRIDQWYAHFDKGQRFYVIDVNEDKDIIEIQNFDGTIDEFDFDTWYDLDIDMCEAPENWSGALDIDNVDDLGTEITDTPRSDWNAPFNEFESKNEFTEDD